MKRRVGDTSFSDSPTPDSRRPKRVKTSLPTREHLSPPFLLAGKEQILVAHLEVKGDTYGHSCATQIHAAFYMHVVGQAKRQYIGYLLGQTIDRAKPDPHQLDQTLFVSEMLNKRPTIEDTGRPMKHGGVNGTNDETEIIMQHIFHRDGTPRDEYSRKCLGGAKLHFVSHFQLEQHYRGCGLAKTALQTYLRGVQHKAMGLHRFRGHAVLSPAALSQKKKFYESASSVKTLVEVEHALIASYERAGFKVWSKGDDSLGGLAITIMGIRITGPKIHEVRTKALSVEECFEVKEAVEANVNHVETSRQDSGL